MYLNMICSFLLVFTTFIESNNLPSSAVFYPIGLLGFTIFAFSFHFFNKNLVDYHYNFLLIIYGETTAKKNNLFPMVLEAASD